MNPLWGRITQANRQTENLNNAWSTFRFTLIEITPEGFEHNDLLQAILNVTEFPDPHFLDQGDLERWSKRLRKYAKQGRLVTWLARHLPEKTS